MEDGESIKKFMNIGQTRMPMIGYAVGLLPGLTGKMPEVQEFAEMVECAGGTWLPKHANHFPHDNPAQAAHCRSVAELGERPARGRHTRGPRRQDGTHSPRKNPREGESLKSRQNKNRP